MRTSPAFLFNREKEEISCLMKLFLCPLPLWKIEATVFHYESVCFDSHLSLVRKSKAISVRSHTRCSHLHSCLRLSPLCRYLPWICISSCISLSPCYHPASQRRNFYFLILLTVTLQWPIFRKSKPHTIFLSVFPQKSNH